MANKAGCQHVVARDSQSCGSSTRSRATAAATLLRDERADEEWFGTGRDNGLSWCSLKDSPGIHVSGSRVVASRQASALNVLAKVYGLTYTSPPPMPQLLTLACDEDDQQCTREPLLPRYKTSFPDANVKRHHLRSPESRPVTFPFPGKLFRIL